MHRSVPLDGCPRRTGRAASADATLRARCARSASPSSYSTQRSARDDHPDRALPGPRSAPGGELDPVLTRRKGGHFQDRPAAELAVETLDPNADVTPFVRAHMEAQLHQVRALDLRERVQHRIWMAVEEAVTAAGLAPRVANAVWDAFFGRSVTPRYYRPLADVSPATATHDLGAAVAAGLLRPEGRARSRRYQAGDGLYMRIGAALGVRFEESGDVARAIIIGELTKRVASERSR